MFTRRAMIGSMASAAIAPTRADASAPVVDRLTRLVQRAPTSTTANVTGKPPRVETRDHRFVR